MLAAEGGIACSFNSTVYGDTLQYVPELVAWAQKHIDIVHTMVFILFRYITPDLPYDFMPVIKIVLMIFIIIQIKKK